MIFNVSGGGGTALNFRVVGGTTAPTNPAENCIWVNTDTPITSWIFSATKPSPAEAGMVLITTGTSSTVEFNALKKNDIQVYPISAKQYVSGAWVDKDAKSYHNGKWVDWVTYLLNGADTCDSITGGWSVRKHIANYPSIGTADFTKAGITLTNPNNTSVSVMTNNKIDLSNKKSIIVKIPNASFFHNGSCLLYFSSDPLSKPNEGTGNHAAAIALEIGENVIDIPSGLVNGAFYVSIGMNVYGGDQSATIQVVYLK